MIRHGITIGLALLLVSSMATGTVAAGALGPVDGADATADVQDVTNESADDIYRYGNGSAVLVYEQDASGEDVSTAEFGADVSSGLVDILVVSETPSEQEATGEFGIEMTPDSVVGDGSLSVQSPESVEDLDASLSGTQSAEESTAQMTLDMTAQAGAGTPQADSNGDITVGADSMSVDATYSVEMRQRPGSVEQSRVVRVDEIDNGYEVEFDENRPINSLLRERWNTSEAAEETIRQQYQGLARQFGGSVEITIHSYDYTEATSDSEQDRLDIEYTVTMNDVKEGIIGQLTRQISASEQVELTDEERQDLEESLMDLTVEQIAFAQNRTASGMDGFVDAEITNYEEPFLTYLGIAASEDGPINESQVETLRQQLEARNAADLEQTLSWDVEVSQEDSRTTGVQAEVNYDTTNWDAYTDELADRGMPIETDIQFEGSAEKVDDTIEIEMSFNVSQDDLVDSAVGQLSDTAEQQGQDETAVETFRSLENADFQVAKADIIFNRDRVEFRASAQFEDLSEFERTVDELPEGSSIRQIYGEGDGDGTTTYVYVDGLDMSDEQLRETALADEDTTINSPGEWDRSFPVMDVQSSADNLGVDAEVNNPPHGAPDGGAGDGTETATPTPAGDMATDTPDEDMQTATAAETPTPTSGLGPGFSVVAALLALLAGALLARRDGRQ
jgi:PGF-CTERM protein